MSQSDTVEIFSDGACSGNPGPGGWGVLLRYRGVEREMSGGEEHTTNNRMEMMAAIVALESLTRGVHARLYTEMVHANAVLHGDRHRLLGFSAHERPLALQLGGSEPALLAAAARIAQDEGFDEVNLNVGCPSDRVQSGRFGACLMREPQLVAESVAAMIDACDVPVTVKCRLGVDDDHDWDRFAQFVDEIAKAGCRMFVVHARNAWLQGLSPKENREVPPLRYEVVRQLKRDFPHTTIVLNGGIVDFGTLARELAFVDGVMLGRAIYHDPYLLAAVDRELFGEKAPPPSRAEVVDALRAYAARELARGTSLRAITRHVLGLYHGVRGGRRFRRMLSDATRLYDADTSLLADAMPADA